MEADSVSADTEAGRGHAQAAQHAGGAVDDSLGQFQAAWKGKLGSDEGLCLCASWQT